MNAAKKETVEAAGAAAAANKEPTIVRRVDNEVQPRVNIVCWEGRDNGLEIIMVPKVLDTLTHCGFRLMYG